MKAIRTALFLLCAFALPALAGEVSAVYNIGVDGLACPFCAYGIEKKLSAIEGVESLDIDIETGMVIVVMTEGATLDEATAREAVKAAGFSLRDFEQAQTTGAGAGES